MEYEGMLLKENATGDIVTTPAEVYEVFKDSAKLAQETFSIATLNSKNKIIREHLITIGTVNSTVVHPRDVFRHAILDNASAIILSHNHPSGDCTPSGEDIKTTKKIVAAGKILSIQVLDHVIIGDTYLSLRENGLVQF